MKFPKIDNVSPTNTFVVTSGALRVSDPCYTPDTWCAGTLENVMDGIWQARVGYHKDSLDAEMAERWLKAEEERINAFGAKHGEDFVVWERERLAEKRKAFEERLGRVAYLHIVNIEAQSHFDHAAEFDSTWVDSEIDVGVDSGQAGFFDLALYQQVWESEAVREKFYDEVCDLTLEDKSWGVHPVGVVSSTGWGDGSYTCLVRRDDAGRAIEAIIIYMAESDGEEGEEGDDSTDSGN
jgi:hypothetical protein